MIRKSLATAVLLTALASGGRAMAGSVDVCTNSTGGPGNGGGVTVSEGGVAVSYGGHSGGTGGANQCLHVDHP